MESGEIVFTQLIGSGNDPEKTLTALKECGYDFAIVDLEHSLINKETVLEYIRASRKAEIPLIVRPEEVKSDFRPYLDAGVNGLMIRKVNTLEEAKQIVNRAYFPPIGNRGCGIVNPPLIDYQSITELPFLKITEYINRNMMVFPQVETLEGIANLNQILQLEGITGTIVGPFDLAVDIGNIEPGAIMSEMITGDVVEEKLRQIARICKDASKVAGTGAVCEVSQNACAKWAKEGYRLFILGYIRDGILDNLKQEIQEARKSLQN